MWNRNDAAEMKIVPRTRWRTGTAQLSGIERRSGARGPAAAGGPC